MPNTSTAGHCVKSNPPLTRPPCTFTNTHTTPPPTHTQHGGETKKEPIVFWTFWISLRKTTQAENVVFFPEFSSSSPSSSGLMALPPSLSPPSASRKDRQAREKKGGGVTLGLDPTSSVLFVTFFFTSSLISSTPAGCFSLACDDF